MFQSLTKPDTAFYLQPFVNPETRTWRAVRPILSTLLTGFLLAEYVFAAAGSFQAVRRHKLALVLYGIITYFAVASGGPESTSRYRHPIIPFVCILAADGFFRVFLFVKTTEQSAKESLDTTVCAEKPDDS